jgi:hypothetical protein
MQLDASGRSRFERTRLWLWELERDFLALDRDLVRCGNPDPHRIAVDLDDRHTDFRSNLKTLAELPAQD